MNTKGRIIIAGGTGFLGTSIVNLLRHQYEEVVILTRHAQPADGNVRYAEWDGEHPGPWMSLVDGSHALINLCGRSVNCRYVEQNRKEILQSRLKSTLILGASVIMAARPPEVWLNAGSATIYRHALDRSQDEHTGEIGHDFSMSVCKEWEKTFFDIPTPSTRKVALRTSLVLGTSGGVYPAFRRLARLGMGGHQGNGKQMMSWIHELDFARIVQFLLECDDLSGAVNCTAPNPVDNDSFMRLIRKTLGIPLGIPHPAWLLEIGAAIIRTETELLLKSRWVKPARLLDAGYHFIYPELEKALEDLAHEKNLVHTHSLEVSSEI